MQSKTPKRLSVTIGVPAYNEAENIGNLLKSVLQQIGTSFRIEKIIVICDGCTDDTVVKVQRFAKKNNLIKLIKGKKRQGKASRLNQLYQLNTSDIIVTLDADIVLSEPLVIDKIISRFTNEKVVVVGANNQPIEARTFIERVYNVSYLMWYSIRKDYRDGNNINNFHGMTMALRASFAATLKIPSTSGDGPFICLIAAKQKKHFHFVKNAIVFFHSVDNLKDFVLQAGRNVRTTNNLAKYFGHYVYEQRMIPLRHKVRGIFRSLSSDPVYTFLAILLNIWIRILPPGKQFEQQSVWKISPSTKKAIIMS